MTFANDGLELALNVPDSHDVKATFGTMVDTVVEQNEEIGRLNTHLDKVVTDNKVSRKKLIDVTTQRLQQLLENQLRLEHQLQAAQQEIKNFSYNIQGYVDENEEAPPQPPTDMTLMESIAIDLREVELPGDDVSIQTGHTTTLYPTEDGGTVESHLSFKSAFSYAGRPKTIRPSKRDLSSLIYYQGIPKFSCPVNPKARWRWACKKVLQTVRLKKLKISLSRTRMDKNNTLIERINKMDADLYAMPYQIESSLKSSMERLLGDVGQQVKSLQEELSAMQAREKQREETYSTRISKLESQLSSLDKRLTSAVSAVEEKQNKLENSLTSSVNELRNQLKDSVALDLDRLRLGLMDNAEALSQLDKAVNGTLTGLQTLVEKNENLASREDLLKQSESNAMIEQHRASGAVEEATAEYLQRSLNTMKRDIAAAQHHYSQKFFGNQAIVSRDEVTRLEEILLRSKTAEGHMKVVRDSLQAMKDLLKKHDLKYTQFPLEVNEKVLQATSSLLPTMQDSLNDLHDRTDSFQDILRDSKEEILHLQDMVDKAIKGEGMTDSIDDIGHVGSRGSGGSRGGGGALSNDAKKEIAALKIQLDAIRNLLFDKSRPGASRIAEASAQAAMLAAGEAVVGPDPLPTEGFGDLIPPDLKGHFTDEELAHMLNPLKSGVQMQHHEMEVAVVDVLKHLIPDLLPPDVLAAFNMPQATGSGQIGTNGSNTAAVGSSGAVGGSSGGGIGPEASMTPSELALQRILSRGRPKVDKGGNELQSAQLPGDPTSIASAIKQVQQVFSSNDSGAKGIPHIATLSPAQRAGLNSASLDGPNQSPSSSPTHRRKASALRGSFDSLGGNSTGGHGHGSRVGSFTLAEFPHPPFDPTPLVNDVATLRAELINTRRKIELMEEEKVTKHLVERLCNEALAEQRRRDARTDYRSMIEDADKSIRDLVQEIIYLKRNQEQSVQTMREELNRALECTVESALQTVTDSLKESVVSTKGLCLSCGRTSNVRSEPQRATSPQPFFPHLSTGSLPGPDVLRGGFKMPVRGGSPPPLMGVTLPSIDKDIPLLMRGKVTQEGKSGRTDNDDGDLSPEVSSLLASYSEHDQFDEENTGRLSPPPPERDPSDQRRPVTGGGEANSSRSERHARTADNNGQRAIFRKGFPVRKSMRAEMNFAPERFELQAISLPGRPQSQQARPLPLASQSLTSFAPPPTLSHH